MAIRRRAWIVTLVCCLAVAGLVQAVGVPPARARGNAATTVPHTRWLSDIWCRPDGSCLAVGATTRGSGVVVVLHSNGSIGPVRLVPGSTTLSSIDCAPGGGCIAVGGLGPTYQFVQIAPDGTPGTARSVPGVDALYDVDCPTASTCLATGSVTEQVQGYPYYKTWSQFIVFENGQPVAVQRFPLDYDDLVVGIDCPTATNCVVVDGKAVVLSNSGGTWSARVTFEPAPDYSGHATHRISCPTSRACWAIAAAYVQTGPGLINVPGIAPVSAAGTVGAVRVLIPRSGHSDGISCAPGTSTCTVVGGLHFDDVGAFSVETTRGSPWEPTYWTNALGFNGVSCVTATSCGLVGGNGSNGVFAWKGPIIS
ncbi:MAG TPA: hypothetical protein VG455_02850 [Acidimicrobiales bacterium]|nr:hypothetical protein [Acidimicrobiales bacterium]